MGRNEGLGQGEGVAVLMSTLPQCSICNKVVGARTQFPQQNDPGGNSYCWGHEGEALSFEIQVPVPQERPEPTSGGQAAYQAYCASTGWRSAVSGDPLPSWADQRPAIRQAWTHAAGAAIDWYLKSVH